MTNKVPPYIHYRRISILRALLVGALMAGALIFFILWYRYWPRTYDCERHARRIAGALDEYRIKNHAMPSNLYVLAVKDPLRFKTEHYKYVFTGIGGPEFFADGTIIAYCSEAHKSLLSDPWRHVLIVSNGRIGVLWVKETLFKPLLSKQKPIYMP